MLKVFLIFSVTIAVSSAEESSSSEVLEWPEKYSLEITQINVKSDLVIDAKIWRTPTKSRIDYNNGAVKTIIDTTRNSGTKYEIHPEADSDEDSSLVCKEITDEIIEDPETILPDTDDFIPIGSEKINDKDCTKFFKHTFEGSLGINETVWATPNQAGKKGWIPLRYEKEEFNTWLGYVDCHDIWEFFNFQDNFSVKRIFNTKKLCDSTSPIKLQKKNKALTKHLLNDDPNNKKHINTNIKKVVINKKKLVDLNKTRADTNIKKHIDPKTNKQVNPNKKKRVDPTTEIVDPKNKKRIDPSNKKHVEHAFKAFKKNYNKKYLHKKDHADRKRIFENNLRRVIETNSQNLGYKLAVNHLADRTPEELKRFTGLKKSSTRVTATHSFPYNQTRLMEMANKLPTEYDLRSEGLVSSVKNQEDCGSCWSFGTTAAMEGALARHTGEPIIALANQALIDCAWPFQASGCDGGSDDAAYHFMMKYGLPTEAEYGSYTDKDGYCNIKNMTKTYKIRGFVDVTPNSVGALKVALMNHGPLSVSVNVNDKFKLYQSGVFYDHECDPKDVNHEVALVGFGSHYGETYWILKNSWGPEWGIAGYMHIAARNNNCGVMTEPTYVTF